MVKRTCEYFSRARKGFIYCENARLKFDTKEQRDEYLRTFCNKTGDENACPIKKSLDLFYLQK